MRWRNSWQLKTASNRTADAYAQLLKQLRQQESEVAEVASDRTADAYAQLLKQLCKQESESFAYDGKGRALHARMYILRRRKEKKKIEKRRTNKKE